VRGGAGGDRFGGLIADVDDAPDAAVFAVDAVGVGAGILVAGIFIVPVSDPDGAVGADFLDDRAEPAVIGADEIFEV
jgi:hypothetical protein